MRKKVGLLTYNSVSNYGALFQAHALQIILKKKSYLPEFIDYWPEYRIPKYIRLPSKKQRSRGRRSYSLNVGYSIYSSLLNLIQNHKRLIYFKDYHKKFLKTAPHKYNTYDELKADCPDYELYIVGSDQLWKPREHYGLDPAYFLSFVKKRDCKLAYAVSLGSDSLQGNYAKEFENLIQNVDIISVREESSVPFVERAAKKEVVSVLDPTLLLDADEWESYALAPHRHYDKFLLVYNLSGNTGLRKLAHIIAEKNNLTVVTVNSRGLGFLFPFMNVVRPEEWLWFFRNAEYVITDSFHGTVFSILNKKKFYTIQPRERSSRVEDLFKKLNINSRLYNTWSDVDVNSENTLDYNAVFARLNELRRDSMSYLDNAISSLESHPQNKL